MVHEESSPEANAQAGATYHSLGMECKTYGSRRTVLQTHKNYSYKKPVQPVSVPEPAPKEPVKVDVEPEQEPLPQENQSTNLATLQQNLNNCLKIIDDEVMKGYLSALDKLPIIETDENQLLGLKPIYFFS